MGRPSKLTSVQEREICQRLASGGPENSNRKVAKDYGVGEATIRRIFSAQVPIVRDVAERLAVAELDLAALPVVAQVSARAIADQLKAVQTGVMVAAVNHAANAQRLSALASRKVARLDEEDVLANGEASEEDLKQVARLTALSNEALKTPMSILTANKDKGSDSTLEDLVCGGDH